MATLPVPVEEVIARFGPSLNFPPEGRVVRIRKAINPPANARTDTRILLEIAKRLGVEKHLTMDHLGSPAWAYTGMALFALVCLFVNVWFYHRRTSPTHG
jgi:hypothetical protein